MIILYQQHKLSSGLYATADYNHMIAGWSNISFVGFQETHKLLQPADKTLKAMAIEFAEYQVKSWVIFYFLIVILDLQKFWRRYYLIFELSIIYVFFFFFGFNMFQVCVDVFITTQTYVDIASISVIPKTTGGQVMALLALVSFLRNWLELFVLYSQCCVLK